MLKLANIFFSFASVHKMLPEPWAGGGGVEGESAGYTDQWLSVK